MWVRVSVQEQVTLKTPEMTAELGVGMKAMGQPAKSSLTVGGVTGGPRMTERRRGRWWQSQAARPSNQQGFLHKEGEMNESNLENQLDPCRPSLNQVCLQLGL